MSNIKELCDNISFNRISSWKNINKSKLNNVISNLGINNDEVIIFYDASLFENAKNGLAICEGGVYWKNVFCPPRYLNWSMFRKLKLSYDNSNIYFGENDSVFVYQTEVESLIRVLQNLKIDLKVDNFVEKTVGILSFVESAVNFINDIASNNSSNNNIIDDSHNEPLAISDSGCVDRNDKVIEVSNFSEVEDISQWTIAGKDIKVGPYTTEEVKGWLNNNKNKYEKLYIWKRGMENWELINNIQEFKDYIDIDDNIPPLPMFD